MKVLLKIYIAASIVMLYFAFNMYSSNFMDLKCVKEFSNRELLMQQKDLIFDILRANMNLLKLFGIYIVIGIVINCIILYKGRKKSAAAQSQ